MASHRRPKKPSRTCTGVFTAAATAVVLAPGLAHAAPADGPEPTSQRVGDLLHEAEVATEEYNGLKEQQEHRQREAAAAQDRLAAEQKELVELHDNVGRMAGAQYREGGLDPTLRLLLSERPEGFLTRAATIDRLGAQQVDLLERIRHRTRVLDTERAEATGRLAELERTRERVLAKKLEVEAKLREAQRLLNLLPAGERQAVVDGGHGGGGTVADLAGPVVQAPVSGRAGVAIAAARRALGKPYVWGATGPNSFDCSGLTGWAWRQAGVSLPRTSQEQARAGRSVPVSQIRPGDLVLYYGGMTHIGMYVGDGKIIHAPRSGSTVRYAPLHSMPVTKVVRVS